MKSRESGHFNRGERQRRYAPTNGRIQSEWPVGFVGIGIYDEGRIVVASHAFVKASRKTPRGEIARAKIAYDDYMAAKQRGELQIEEDPT